MIREEAYILTKEFIEKSGMQEGELMVVGCSTSEVIGSSIGKDSNPDVAKEIFEGIYEAACESRIYIAIARSYKDEDNNSCKYWYKKAYRNAVNDKELQSEILKEIELIKI